MPQNVHPLKRYDSKLESIHTYILKMGNLVGTQFQQVLLALNQLSNHLARQVLDQDHQLHKLQVKIDSLCSRVFTNHKPTKCNLHLIVTAAKIIIEFEHIGVESRKIDHITERRALLFSLAAPSFSEIHHAAEPTKKYTPRCFG